MGTTARGFPHHRCGQTTITFPNDGVLGEPITSGVAETWSMWAVVDCDYDVEESDEGNNVEWS